MGDASALPPASRARHGALRPHPRRLRLHRRQAAERAFHRGGLLRERPGRGALRLDRRARARSRSRASARGRSIRCRDARAVQPNDRRPAPHSADLLSSVRDHGGRPARGAGVWSRRPDARARPSTILPWRSSARRFRRPARRAGARSPRFAGSLRPPAPPARAAARAFELAHQRGELRLAFLELHDQLLPSQIEEVPPCRRKGPRSFSPTTASVPEAAASSEQPATERSTRIAAGAEMRLFMLCVASLISR